MTVPCPHYHANNHVAGLRLPEPWRLWAVEPQVRCFACRKMFTPKETEKEGGSEAATA